MKNNIPNCYTKEEWEKVKKQFDTDFKRYNKHIKSFRELINEILDGETEGTFVNKTELSYNMFSRIRTQVDKKNPPQRNTLMSIAVGYKLDYQITSALLNSIGLDFILSNPRDYAYQFLLTNCRGKSIDERYLLGAHARKKQ